MVKLSDVSFIQKGKGKDLVFLHGYGSSKEAFSAQISYFSRFFRVTAIDFLGFGKSQSLSQPFSVADYADWTIQTLELLGVQTPYAVAHSFGCRVAVKMAGECGYPFQKLLLTGPAGVILNRGFAYQLKVWTYRVLKKIAPTYAETHFGSAEYRALSGVMKESYKKIVNEDLRACAAKVLCEVLLVEGEEDTVTTMKEAQAYLQSFPKAKLKTIGGGHFAFAENPVAFNLITEGFFL